MHPFTAAVRKITKALLMAFVIGLIGCREGYRISDVSLQSTSTHAECTIWAEQTHRDIIVHVRIANQTSKPFQILESDFPGDGRLMKDVFDVTRDGNKVGYRGPSPAGGAKFVTIPSGHVYTADITLRQAYEIELSGNYEITYQTHNARDGSRAADDLMSNNISVEVW